MKWEIHNISDTCHKIVHAIMPDQLPIVKKGGSLVRMMVLTTEGATDQTKMQTMMTPTS